MIVIPCKYDDIEDHKPHEFPDDWELGGPTGLDPRADVRWRGDTYYYFDADLTILSVTQVPLCDDQAIDEFTRVGSLGSKFNPRYLQVKRAGTTNLVPIPWHYYKETDEVIPA